jgi:predicted ATPase/transcriptional regulator with XRE-family HTH domain
VRGAVDPADGPSFATLLKRYRSASHLTQEVLAERAGLSREAISALERGECQYPRADTVGLLVTALGLNEAEHAALLRAARPQLKSRAATPEPVATSVPAPTGLTANWLPVPPTPLLGRRRELAKSCAFLLQGGARLLTLTGPGGVGKTRLALEVAATCRKQFADGAVFVQLASLRAPALVADTLAHAVGAFEQGDRRAEDLVVEHLRERHMLLVMDNFEHLVSAAPVVAEVLSLCPKLAFLVISRRALHLRGERVLPLAPLTVPPDPGPTSATSIEDLVTAPAIVLFVERAQAVRPEFELTEGNAAEVAAICRHLDGLPLAIELAAARTSVLPPRALLDRLEHRLDMLTDGPRDLPPRQQTLRAALAWSYDLLEPNQQALFRQLGVFVGGASLEAITQVTRATDALSGVAALIDHGLVRRLSSDDGSAEPSVGMLETIREYARSLLAEADEEPPAEAAHARYYLQLAETAELELLGPGNSRWMSRLEAEIDNIRGALEWTRGKPATDLRLRLAGALWYFWFMSWRLTECRHWLGALSQAEAADVHGSPAALRARTRAFAIASFIAFNQGEYSEATTLAGRGFALHARTAAYAPGDRDDRAAHAYRLTLLGFVGAADGHMPWAWSVMDEALGLARASGDSGAVVMALRNLGIVARWQCEYERAEMYLRECVAEARSMLRYRDYLVAWGLSNLGRTLYLRGQIDEARTCLEQTLGHIERSSFAGHTLADGLDWLAAAHAARGRLFVAARLFGAAAEQWRTIGAMRFPLDRPCYERDVASVRAQLDARALGTAWASGEAMDAEAAVAYALAAT